MPSPFRRTLLLLLLAPLLLMAASPVAASVQDAQSQVALVVGPLSDSEAEYAAGSYVPGLGAVFTLELRRGPNSIDGKPADEGVRDWVIYLMQAYGPWLTAVPPGETIAMSVSYYNYDDDLNHLLTVSSPAGTITDPTTYSLWLDGNAYGGPAPETNLTVVVPTAAPRTPTALPIDDVETVTPTPDATPVPGPVDVELTFDADNSIDDWAIASGSWRWSDGAYEQVDLKKFDLASYYTQPIAGDYRFSADLQFIDGEMGAGLIFNAPDPTTKRGAQMVSFAGNGSFLQWGYYDTGGVFQYEGGVTLDTPVNDQAWHTLAVEVVGPTYSITLDGVVLGKSLESQAPAGGYAGLLVSTSNVRFDNVVIASMPS